MEQVGFYKEKANPNEPKGPLELAMHPDQVKQLLDTIKKAGQTFWKRDFAAIYLGFSFALRVSEACLLERKHFRFIDRGRILIPTLKRNQKIPHQCGHCGWKARLSAKRIGVRFPCARCSRFTVVKSFKKLEEAGPKEVPLPMVEPHVIAFVKKYLKELPSGRDYLFGGRKDRIKSGMLTRIFGTYIQLAKMSPHYTWHSLRHGRAVQVAEITRDAGAVRDFLRHTSTASALVYMTMTERSRSRLQRRLEDSALKGVTA